MNDYEKYFEEVQDQSIRITELIEQLIQLEHLITMHKQYNSAGLELDQYLDRKEEFSVKLNEVLMPHKMKLVYQEV